MKAADVNEQNKAGTLPTNGRGLIVLKDLPKFGSNSTNNRAEQVTHAKREKVEKISPVSSLIEDLKKTGAQLFHTVDRESFVSFRVEGHFETYPIQSETFKRYLSHLYYKKSGKSIGRESLSGAQNLAATLAECEGELLSVYRRVGELHNKLYFDFGSPDRKVVEITSQGCSIVDNKKVKFYRPRGMQSLPTPDFSGNIQELFNFINVKEEQRVLVLAYLTAAYRIQGPYPILVLQGGPGSSKSTTSQVLRRLVDPNSANLRAMPNDIRDLFIAANNSWMMCFDNVSSISDTLSDALCRIATGGGYATRALFTDDGEKLFNVRRPIIINGIGSTVNRGDLLDRALIIECPKIPTELRITEQAFWRQYEEAVPRILGALLKAVSRGMANLPSVQLNRHPRMADFAQWGVATEVALGFSPGAFMAAYEENQIDAHDTAIEALPIIESLKKLLGRSGGCWQGTATALHDAITIDNMRIPPKWPRNGQALVSQLQRIEEHLLAANIMKIERMRLSTRERTRVLKLSLLECKTTLEIVNSNEMQSNSMNLYSQDGTDAVNSMLGSE